jgi:hypothetical protein
MEYLKKVEEEKYLYSHENPDGTQTYFVRKVENGKDTTECLNTNRIGTARKLRDGWVHGRTSKKLGIIEKVEEKGPVLIAVILDAYEKAGYPDHQGNPKKSGDHLTLVPVQKLIPIYSWKESVIPFGQDWVFE